MNTLHKQSSEQLKAADTEKILLVEDNEVNIEIAVDMLGSLGFTVACASNGEEAVNLYAKNQYILILMDCEMPIMDGFDAASKIREIERQGQRIPTPIVALSAHTSSGAKEKCVASGMNDFLGKPFGVAELKLMLHKWLIVSAAEQSELQACSSDDAVGNNNLNSDNLNSDSNESTILNYEVLNNLQKKQKNSNLVNRIIKIYLEQSSRLLIELITATHHADIETVRRISHTLKSSSINVGAIKLSELCRQVELLCEQGILENTLIQQIHTSYSKVEKALNELLLEQ